MTKEQETAMYDQPDQDEPGWWEEIRDVGRRYGFNFETITVNGLMSEIDLKAERDVAKAAEPIRSEFGDHATEILKSAIDVYQQRNAVYKDNFRVVGRVMEALFPSGAPRLYDVADFNRWHIFELIIVKLTRYVANWDEPDRDSLVDMLPYLAILGAQDDELRERIAEQIAETENFARRVRSAGLFVEQREEDNEAKTHALDDLLDEDEPVVKHAHKWNSTGQGVIYCACGASRRVISDSPQA